MKLISLQYNIFWTLIDLLSKLYITIKNTTAINADNLVQSPYMLQETPRSPNARHVESIDCLGLLTPFPRQLLRPFPDCSSVAEGTVAIAMQLVWDAPNPLILLPIYNRFTRMGSIGFIQEANIMLIIHAMHVVFIV